MVAVAFEVVELITVRFVIEARAEVNVSIVPVIARNTEEKNEVVVASPPTAVLNERFDANALVEVEFVVVPKPTFAFVAVRFVVEALNDVVFVANAFVEVEFVVVELITLRFAMFASIDVKLSIDPNTVFKTTE